jgi:CubicO group peptidase (beta-lactamase class C family)
MKPKVLLGLLFTVSLSFGQNQHLARIDATTISKLAIDSTIHHFMDAATVTGLGLAIINDDTIVYARTYGFKNLATKELMDTSSVFYGASLSKAVFAYICLELVEQRVLNLDTPLYRYLDKPLPGYPNYSDLAEDDRWQLITARMCLSHSTGLPNWRFLNARTGQYDPKGKLAIYFTPGSKYAYSGEAFVLLQMVVEHLTGKNLEALASRYVFVPIGMNRSSYVWQQRFEDNYALGYDANSNPLEKKKRTTPNAAGSLETTLADYARFLQYIMQRKGLSDQMLDTMLTPQIHIHSKREFPTITDEITAENGAIDLSCGLGWGLLKCQYGRAFFKGGHDDGWEHYNINFIDKGISMLVMTNSSNSERIYGDIFRDIIGDVFTPWKWL